MNGKPSFAQKDFPDFENEQYLHGSKQLKHFIMS